MEQQPKEHQSFLFDEKTAGILTSNKHDQQALQDLGLLMPIPGGGEIIKALLAITLLLLHWLSFPVEMLIRKDFGIRYVSIIRWMAANTIWGMMGIGLMLFLHFDVLTWVYSFTVTVMFFFHYWRARQRQRQGEIWYTMSWGISRFEWLLGKKQIFGNIPYLPQFDDWFLYRFVEPAFCLVVALIFFQIEDGFGFLLMLSTAGLFIKANMSYGAALNRVYDMIDASVEGEYYNVSLGGASKQDTAGFAAVQLPKGLREYSSAEQAVRDVSATVAGTLSQRITTAPRHGVLKRATTK